MSSSTDKQNHARRRVVLALTARLLAAFPQFLRQRCSSREGPEPRSSRILRPKLMLLIGLLLFGAVLFCQAHPLPCDAERERLAELMKELKDLKARPNPRPTPILDNPDPPAPSEKEEAIAAWHAEHDEEVRLLRSRLASPICGATPPPVLPDIGLQVVACLDVFSIPGELDLRQELLDNVKLTLKDLNTREPDKFPNPNVAAICSGKRETIGIWRAASSNTQTLESLQILPDGANFAFRVFPTTIRSLADSQWVNLPKRYDDSGKANANGSVELRNYDLIFSPPNRVILQVKGTYHAAIDVNFTVTYTDNLSISSEGIVQCRPERNLDVNVAPVQALLSIFIPFPINWIPLDILRSKLDLVQAPSKTTAGCMVAGILPSTILLPKKGTDGEARKIVFPYDTVTVDPARGVMAFGNVPPLLKARQPAVRLVGADPVIVHASDAKEPVRVRFFAQTEDMRGALSVKWSTTRGRILSQHDQFIEIEYPATNGNPGDVFSGGRISVQVMDEDGLLTSTGRAVRIEVREDPVRRPRREGTLTPEPLR